MAERAQVSIKKPEAKRENKASQTQKTGHSQSISSPVEQILFLQRTIGNQAVGRLIKSRALQAKLRIGQPGDIYEQEADRVAEQVMRMPEPLVSKEKEINDYSSGSSIKRKCPECKPKKEENQEHIQAKEDSGSTPEAISKLESNIRAIRGGGQPLSESTRGFFEPRFGTDFSGVRVHTDTNATYLARSINSKAFTVGRDVVFCSDQYQPDMSAGKQLIAHELTHVVQQMPNNSHANEIIQRFAFINENQVRTTAKGLTPEIKAMVSDNLVRNYTSMQEFENHSAKKTDYLGNLAGTAKAGTWLRFHPDGINILGENHTLVKLSDVTPAVGSKSFIYEPFSADILPAGSFMKTAYEKENEPEFKRFGVEKEPEKRKFGAESLFPKMGYGLTLATPYFLKNPKNPISDLKTGNYVGQPVQRYLKIAWGYSKDNLEVINFLKAIPLINILIPSTVPKMLKLATVHEYTEGILDKFITSLPVEGYLGDELDKPENDKLFLPLAEFALAFTDAMVEMAAYEKSSRLSEAERKKLLSATSIDEAEKMKLFANWRDYNFEDNVKDAAQQGVRYAGMGLNHLKYLVKVGLPSNGHPYDMDGKDLQEFEKLTKKLRSKAKRP